MKTPFYIDDLDALREKLTSAESRQTLMGQVWGSVRRRARNAPKDFPWFTPFAALITGDKNDIGHAKDAIRGYIGTLDSQSFGMGLQFHFWCFAFPHSRWALFFQWLAAIGAWDAEEERQIREQLLIYQYVNFFSGMRTKPEPECVDNQSMSLCFSNALVGHIFSEDAMARRMREDGLRRLPSMIGGLPSSGYSGEGSQYMDGVVGPSIPLLVELLERTSSEEWFGRSLAPHGGSAENVCRMIGREWMPNGLLLPWDHYGYMIPSHSCVAYSARRMKDPFYAGLLEHHANWASAQGMGWGYDDLVWALIWWPQNHPESQSQTRAAFASWNEPEVGAALVSDDAQLYAMQMWDESAPVYPGRSHVNPNALVLSAYGSPLTTDGVPDKGCTAFDFADTWREVGFMDLGEKRKFNFGSGCGGSHSVILVDRWEGMRASREYRQADQLGFSAEEKSVATDVTPIYREKFDDVLCVRRRTRLCHERFWLIEDLAAFKSEHRVTARFFLRPHRIESARGVAIETAEGVRLTLIPLLGPDDKTVTTIQGYPDRLDGASLQVDFKQRGAECRWLWLEWPEATREVREDVSDHWQAAPDAGGDFTFEQAGRQFAAAAIDIPLTTPPYLLRDLPIVRRWWFRRAITVPPGTASWLRLPKEMFNLRVWIHGEELDITPHRLRMNLMEPEIALPPKWAGQAIVVTLCCDTGYSQYGPDNNQSNGFHGKPVILVEQPAPGIGQAAYSGNIVTVCSGGKEWKVNHPLMEEPR